MTGVEDVKPGSLKAWMAFTRPKTWGVAVGSRHCRAKPRPVRNGQI